MWSESIPHRFKKMKSANYKKCHRPIRRFFRCFKNVKQQIFQNFVKFGKSSWKSKNRNKFSSFSCTISETASEYQVPESRNKQNVRSHKWSLESLLPVFGRDSSIRLGQYPFFLIQELRCDFKFFCSILMSYQLTINW